MQPRGRLRPPYTGRHRREYECCRTRAAQVTDPRLVEERRGQIVRAAVKLFSEEGYYTTTIQQIAREAGVSTGLIYQYFGDKDDILFLTLKLVLDTYEHEIPPRLEGVEHPVDRLCMALLGVLRHRRRPARGDRARLPVDEDAARRPPRAGQGWRRRGPTG